ncbi:MAG TPA: hypothetical protein VGR42_07910, partial [Casimicrobiaceae bacterium]|nr:hypothetical protein [Casimicrobiaceae bacterium]
MGRQRSPVERRSASAAVCADGIACPAAQIAGASLETTRRLRHPASAAIVALFLAFLGFSFCGNAKAAGVVSWTADGYGTPYDPDAHPSLYRWSHAKKAIAAGADGTVYVTGSTAPQGDEVLTIKYNRINGAAEWRVFARGVSNVFGGGSAIGVDAGGNVYVAGALSYNSPAFGIGFVTLKYDQNGVEVWRTLDTTPGYVNPETLALDAAGNIYVAGRFCAVGCSRTGYLTIKYDSSGVEVWRATLSNAILVDTPVSLGLDSTGNVYLAAMTDVSGRNGYLAVSYDASGAERWRAFPKASSVSDDTFSQAAFDASGNVYLTGTSVDASTTRAFTIKYDRNGAEKWRFLGQASREASEGIAVDGSGNVYVSGTAVGGGCGNWSAVAAKYDPSGVQQWRTLSGICNRDVFGASIAVDAALNVMVTGSVDFGGDSDYMTIKYSASGAELWRARATGTPTSHDEGLALVTDGAGNAYVTGTSDADGNEDWLTIKYDTAGVEQWRANEGVAWTDALFASGQEFSRQRAMATDAQGSVYVTGYVEPINHAVDFFNLQTIKLDSNGAELWRAAATTPGGDSLGHALAVDGTGSVYVTGRSGINNDLSYLTV